MNGKATIQIYEPKPTDRYNPTDPYFGNTNLGKTSCSESLVVIDWLSTLSATIDLRLSALTCSVKNGVAQYSQTFQWG